MNSASMILVKPRQCNVKLFCSCAISSQSVWKEYGGIEVCLPLKNKPGPSGLKGLKQ